jgi:hypothetical protein
VAPPLQSSQGSRNSGTSWTSHGRCSIYPQARCSPSAPVFSGGSSTKRDLSWFPFSNWHSRMVCGRSGSPLGRTWAAGSSSSETTIKHLANPRRPSSSSRSIPQTTRSLPCKRGRLTFLWPRVLYQPSFSTHPPLGPASSSSSSSYAFPPFSYPVSGIESGGHGSASAPPILNLVPQILSALPPSGAPPVLAAGGLSSGGHLAAFLTLGAAGAVVGTRFLVADESQYSDAHKRAIVAAKSGSAVRSYVFDELRGSTGWPAGVDGRALSIPALAAIEGGADITQIKEEVAEGTKRGDPNSVIAWAGTGVGQLSRLQPAKVKGSPHYLPVYKWNNTLRQDIVRELHEGAVAHLKASSILVGTA